MEQIVIGLLMVINLMIIIGTSASRDRWKSRCKELKNYIRFVESVRPIEDEADGAHWINERADKRAKADIQDMR